MPLFPPSRRRARAATLNPNTEADARGRRADRAARRPGNPATSCLTSLRRTA